MGLKYFFMGCLIWCFFITSYHCRAQDIEIADSLRENGNYAEAINAYTDFILQNENQPSLNMGNAHMRIGNCYKIIKKNEPALIAYFKALKIFEELQNPNRIAAVTSNISNTYFMLLDFKSAEKYIKKSEALYERLNDSSSLTEVFNDEALIEREKGNLNQAISIRRKALLNYKNAMSGSTLCKHLFDLGSCYGKNNIDSAIYFYFEAEKVAVAEEDSFLLSVIYNNIGDAYKEKQIFKTALYYLEKSKALNSDYGDSTDLATIYQNFADVYDSLKQYDKAYYYSTKERELNEIIYKVEKAKFANELSEKYESDKKDEKIKTQTTESKLKTRNLYISLISLGLVSILGGISFSNYRKKQKANKILQEQNERIEKLNAQLDNSNQVKSKLFSVISHDLRSPISSLYSYLQMQNNGDEVKNTKASMAVSAQTEQLLETLEDLLIWSKSQLNEFVPVKEKVGLHNLATQLITLFAGEIENKALVLENRINTCIRLNTDLNMLTIILRNLIANAVKYAPVGSTILINALETPAHLSISISNAVVDEQGLTSATFNPSAVNSNAAGLGFVLINEFAEKLQATLEHTVSNGRLDTVLQFQF